MSATWRRRAQLCLEEEEVRKRAGVESRRAGREDARGWRIADAARRTEASVQDGATPPISRSLPYTVRDARSANADALSVVAVVEKGSADGGAGGSGDDVSSVGASFFLSVAGIATVHAAAATRWTPPRARAVDACRAWGRVRRRVVCALTRREGAKKDRGSLV